MQMIVYLFMHSVVSLPDFQMQTHWSGQSDCVVCVSHNVIHNKVKRSL